MLYHLWHALLTAWSRYAATCRSKHDQPCVSLRVLKKASARRIAHVIHVTHAHMHPQTRHRCTTSHA